MAETALRKIRASFQEVTPPKLSGSVVTEADDSIVMRAGGCIVEIPLDSIRSRHGIGDETKVTLEEDAVIYVGTLVSVRDGFVEDNVFGALTGDVLSCNCNCNCNCGCSNCNCNCNCCDAEFSYPAAANIEGFAVPLDPEQVPGSARSVPETLQGA